jgi:hypothetical protein
MLSLNCNTLENNDAIKVIMCIDGCGDWDNAISRNKSHMSIGEASFRHGEREFRIDSN